LTQDSEWRQLLEYANVQGCYKGCPFPKAEEELGRTEAKFAAQLREECEGSPESASEEEHDS